jgi:chemotaxis protein methyltransferase CheR
MRVFTILFEGLNMPSAVSHKIEDYESLLVALQNVLGVVVPETQRSCLVERVEPLLVKYRLDSLASLAESLQGEQADEIRSSVLEAVSQRQSDWSISPTMLSVLHQYVFAQLPDDARIWLVECGQGQLAYAMAIEIAEYEKNSGKTKNFQLFATDSAQNDVKLAELATYSTQQSSGLSEGYRKLYTVINDTGDSHTVKDKIRQNLHFSQCNLTEDFQSIGAMDLIICPEALVYFSNGVKKGILQQFSTLLKSGGIFLTGSNQAVTPFTDGFERVDHPAGVFYRQKS